MNAFTLEVYIWLQELEEHICCDIVSESEVDFFYSDTFFEISGNDSWDAYNVQVKIPGRFYKKLNIDFVNEKSTINDAIQEVAKKDKAIVRFIDWTLKLSHHQVNDLNDGTEKKAVRTLLERANTLNLQTKREVINGVNEYKKTKYLSSIKILYPVIEQICNEMLISKGEDPKESSGLSAKLNKLNQLGYIENQLLEAISINKPRNSVLHGSFNPDPKLNKLIHPLCISSMLFLTELINVKQNI